MTHRRRSATARSVPAQTPEQLLELTQEHIRPLIAMIDRLNEAGAEDELRGHQTTHAAGLQGAAAPQRQVGPQSRSARRGPCRAAPVENFVEVLVSQHV
jgi:hypothetical protein